MLSMTGCSWFQPREVQIVTKPVQVAIPQPVLPRAIQLEEPHFYVVSEENITEFLEEVKSRSGQIVFVAMTVDDYELMAYNMQEIKRYVSQMQQVIVYYRTVTTQDEHIDESD